MPDRTTRLLIPAALLAVYLIWGSTYLAIRWMVETIPPLLGNGIRLVVAGAILYAWLRREGIPRPERRLWLNSTMVGTLLFVGGLGQVSIAESIGIGSGVAATAIAMTPVWASLSAGIWGDWPGRKEWLGLAIGVAGTVVLSREGDFLAQPTGLVLVVVAPMLWSLGSVWSNHLAMPEGSMRTALVMLCGGGALLVAGLIRGEVLVEPSTASALSLAYLSIFGSLIAFSAYAYLLRVVRPALATSYAYVNPIVAIVLGVWLGRETITGSAWIALPLIVTAVALIAAKR